MRRAKRQGKFRRQEEEEEREGEKGRKRQRNEKKKFQSFHFQTSSFIFDLN
jgi:hypothetical protein